jgi:hypothetical protein
MIDRIILSAVLSVTGYNGLFPDPPKPLTPAQLQVQAKEKSISAMCDRKPKSKAAKDLCRRWRKHGAGTKS